MHNQHSEDGVGTPQQLNVIDLCYALWYIDQLTFPIWAAESRNGVNR